eukprot:jgi/Bigna1/145698/aug1.102_g20406
MNENKGMNSASTQEAGAVPQSQAPSADCVGWEDITEELRETSSGMKIGTMIHGPDFSLYEAMSALELMDPKMDPGMAISPEDVKKQEDDQSSKAVSKDMKLVDLQEDEIIAVTNGKIFISELEKILKVIRSTQKLAAAVTPGFDLNISRTLVCMPPPRARRVGMLAAPVFCGRPLC